METFEIELQQTRKEFYYKTVKIQASSIEEAQKIALAQENGENWKWADDEMIETVIST